MDPKLLSERWDAEYKSGKYTKEPPLSFVCEILAMLDRFSKINGRGLYVGCGNGRNYVPLVDAGLNIDGLDVSPVALDLLSKRNPTLTKKLYCSTFQAFQSNALFDYIIAIQVFQHGTETECKQYFGKVLALLKPGGLFFLRVNSSSTQPFFRHEIIEENSLGGFTVKYLEGPKQGLAIHFYSQNELLQYTGKSLQAVSGPFRRIIPRKSPQTGQWEQWEAIFQKTI